MINHWIQYCCKKDTTLKVLSKGVSLIETDTHTWKILGCELLFNYITRS